MEGPDQDKQKDSAYWNDMIGQNGVFSATECTGMIPTPPLNDEQVEGYLDIFHVPQQKAQDALKADNPEEQKLRSPEF